MFDALAALLGLALFAIFSAILVWWVGSIALGSVLGITIVMVAYDFWLEIFRSGPSA